MRTLCLGSIILLTLVSDLPNKDPPQKEHPGGMVEIKCFPRALVVPLQPDELAKLRAKTTPQRATLRRFEKRIRELEGRASNDPNCAAESPATHDFGVP